VVAIAIVALIAAAMVVIIDSVVAHRFSPIKRADADAKFQCEIQASNIGIGYRYRM
jgi:hypothetical protein